MEKVIAVYGYDNLSTYDLSDVQQWLDRGWRVKSITMHNIKNCTDSVTVNAIFVLVIKNQLWQTFRNKAWKLTYPSR